MRTIGKIAGIAIAAGFMQTQAQTFPVNIRGTVLDNRSGVAVAGANVTLAGNTAIKATTDAQGNFTLTGSVVVGVNSGARGARPAAMIWNGGEIRFAVPGEAPVVVEVFGLDSRKAKTLLRQNLAAGEYRIQSPAAGLPAGLYVVRGRVGGQSAAFRISSLGAGGAMVFGKIPPGSAALTKAAMDALDTLKVTKDSYVPVYKPINMYQAIYQVEMNPKLAAGDLKLISERGMPQVNWGLNVDVQVWDNLSSKGSELRGNYPNGFEGPTSWLVKFVPDQSYSAWGFVANSYPEDMSAWANGAMHIAVKGTVQTLGVTMASSNQPGGLSQKVQLSEFGYKPDNKWYEANIPLSRFTGTDFSQITVYLGLVTPGPDDTVGFNQEFFYQVDDVYWKTTR